MKKIVIIGGGFTGSLCAKKLEKNKNFSVILIDNKSYFEYTPSILRTIMEPEHEKKIQKLHEDYLKKTKAINDEVAEVTKNYVLLKNKKQKISFDYLIISSGSSYSIPIKEANLVPVYRAKELSLYHNKLKKAKRVLIIGGGLVGVELAAEICTHYKKKEITLVHSHHELIQRNNKKSRIYAESFLKRRNIRIIFNEEVKEGKKKNTKFYLTDKGTRIKTDMAFICVGIKPNFEFMQEKFRKCLNEKNQIRVNGALQLEGNHNIFVGGDVTSIPEEKTAQTSKKHAILIVKNIYNLENSKQLVKYKSKRRPMVISLGKYDGIFEYKNVVLTGLIPAFLKLAIEKKTMWKYS